MATRMAASTSLLFFGLTGLIAAAGSPAASAPRLSEREARTVCVDQAKRLKLKVPAGACEDPRSAFRIRMFAAHRELCEKSSLIQQGQVKCVRAIANDK